MSSYSNGMLAQFLGRGVPVHFGGMSDPFQPAEVKFGVTKAYLETLRDFSYPTVISTRSVLIREASYLQILRRMAHVVVQFSFSTVSDAKAERIEPHAPRPSDILKAMELVSNEGVSVTVRWQPYIPGFSDDPTEFVRVVGSAGCKHIGLEHLKVPVERNHPLWTTMSSALGYDPREAYRSKGGYLDGRDYMLPAKAKLEASMRVGAECRAAGITYGAADLELLHFSDTGCCCSGVDQFDGFGNWFKFQIANAVRSSAGEAISLRSIGSEWRPEGSIDRYLNSKSRIGNEEGLEGSVEDHIRRRWNSPGRGFSPASMFGVEETQVRDEAGDIVYRMKPRPA